MRLNKLISLLALLISVNVSFATSGVVQFSGLVVETGTMEPASYTSVYLADGSRGVIANSEGFFSMAVEKGDTIVFQCIGYKTKKVVIPETIDGDSYITTVILDKDIINLKEVVVRPLPEPALLRQAIVNLEVPDDLLVLADETFAQSQLEDWSLGLKYDGSESFKAFVDKTVQQNYSEGQAQPMKIADIAAWAQFINSIKKGKFKKKDDD